MKNKSKKSLPKNYSDKKDSDKQSAVGQVIPRSIELEMRESYLDYAMSVIVSRALPDVRDGLKPVHRRVLYAMQGLGLKSTAKYRKSATVVGEVLGKYHPHGDTAVYDSLVRLAQDFSMRYQLVDGQGNFGSLDGDGAAAMRYTECRLTKPAEEMLKDLDKETVAWMDNYDSTRKEPKVLPANLPNLLLNGTVGIAVGMATNIPPHNLGELIDAIALLIENPDTSHSDLMEIVNGPDFPTGGIIYDWKAIKEAYATGRGGMAVRGKADIVEGKDGKFQIIITEIPYQVNKANLLQQFADLVNDKKIEGIKDLRDESDKDGVRIVVDLKKEALPNKILNQLYKSSQLQETYHLNMLALVDGIEPRVLNLKSVLEYYIKHRQEVVRLRTEFELKKAKDRAHILEGLSKALKNIDAVIQTIKKSENREIAHHNLMKKFRLTDLQAGAILEMRLSTLSGLERKKIDDELKEKKKLIAHLEDILRSAKKILEIVKKELLEVREKYADERRTKLVKQPLGEFKVEDLIPDESTIVVITKTGYVKRLAPDTYRTQTRGGKGVIGMTTKDEDIVEHLLSSSTHDDILFFTNKGRVFQTKIYELPVASRTAKGQALVNFLQLQTGEVATAVYSRSKNTEVKYLVMATKNGVIKKTEMAEFEKVRRSGLIAINLKSGDELQWIHPSMGGDEVVLVTSQGQSIRFSEKQVRPMGRTASGVRGLKLKKDDFVIAMDVVYKPKDKEKLQLLVVSSHGLGKRSDLGLYKVQGRGGGGIKTLNVTEKTGEVVGAYVIDATAEKDLVVISEKGQTLRTKLQSIPTLGRATQGVRIMKLASGDKIASASLV
ncbi:MAG: DNA gyrase subunit A [Candidatus Doudnabacteria bacterium CG10_big_fil_rev_8_21_14_0_10_41_10]|uniref:DNA gyrase subunit A n=1 Tax=Candidatus Doudnabacteria bacterium CG10_big_fil_rev_8_21_14_0_10_41_10 TaxID=1974551 RepID=A0A2H0VDS8_9BACT|nr:MAG: DNA gyrase subunit A [Candidatus Doudnabacteria bacterium CG10_big_fil_rev_8_21_14_0_10_41_10]